MGESSCLRQRTQCPRFPGWNRKDSSFRPATLHPMFPGWSREIKSHLLDWPSSQVYKQDMQETASRRGNPTACSVEMDIYFLSVMIEIRIKTTNIIKYGGREMTLFLEVYPSSAKPWRHCCELCWMVGLRVSICAVVLCYSCLMFRYCGSGCWRKFAVWQLLFPVQQKLRTC